jgi:predicted transcriptional regulator
LSATKLTADIVAAYLDGNRLAAAEIPDLIHQVHRAISTLGQDPTETVPAAPRPTAAQIKRSIRREALVSFLDGRPYKMLKRHLGTYGLTPEEYRSQFGLPADYPMTAPAYSEWRSSVAKAAGLGNSVR